MNHPQFNETDLVFVAEIANMQENLFNLENEFHAKKTNYFGEGRMVTLKEDELYKYLTAAAPVFSDAINHKYQIVANEGNNGFKMDFLSAITESTLSLSLSFTLPSYESN